MNHSYAAVRCKSCRKIIALKYLGPQDGRTIYLLTFPPPPVYAIFTLQCESCGATNQYLRTDIEHPISEEAPPADFRDQLPLTSVLTNPSAN